VFYFILTVAAVCQFSVIKSMMMMMMMTIDVPRAVTVTYFFVLFEMLFSFRYFVLQSESSVCCSVVLFYSEYLHGYLVYIHRVM